MRIARPVQLGKGGVRVWGNPWESGNSHLSLMNPPTKLLHMPQFIAQSDGIEPTAHSACLLAKQVAEVILQDAFSMRALQSVQALDLPDWAIGAGFVRNVVWDHLHGFYTPTPLPDIDVLYYDRYRLTASRDREVECQLNGSHPGLPWSVRNQARMHHRNGDQPYRSTLDALHYWLEKPTAVAVRLDQSDQLEILAPFGLECLVGMRGEPMPRGLEKYDQYLTRMRAKNWPATWPEVRVQGLPLSH